MKTSLKKLRGFAGLKHDHRRDKRQRQPMAQGEEIALAHQEMREMRDCYDRLLAAAAATTNSVYEFSESLKEIGDCILEKTALSNFDDDESGKVLLMLGKVQLELQRLVDVYRSHISLTITVPSESLLNELQTVEEMKSQCEGKRLAYEEALRKHKEKGKLKSETLDSFPSQNLQDASDDYDQEVNSLLFRVRSLKQGQCRSLLTQAARHHAAQLSFFKKAYLSLEAVEPYVKSVAKNHHIDYEFSGLEDDSGDDDDDEYSEDNGDDASDAGSSDDSELSFDDRQDHPRKPIEDVEQLSPGYNNFSFRKEVKAASKSAPLFSDRRSDANYKPIEMRPSSSQKHELYALPTPLEAKSLVSAKLETGNSQKGYASLSSLNSYHSSPLGKNRYEKLVTNDLLSGPLLSDTKSVPRGNHQNIPFRPLPPPSLNGFSQPQVDPSISSDTKSVKRYAFSGPLTGKQWQHKPPVTSSGPIGSAVHTLHSGSLLRTPREQPLSTSKLPSHTSSAFLSTPKINELHELPRPPPHLAWKKNVPHFDYSEPLRPKGTELSTEVSTLSIPPFLSRSYRSYSTPKRGQVREPMVADIPSSLTPILLSRIQPAATTS